MILRDPKYELKHLYLGTNQLRSSHEVSKNNCQPQQYERLKHGNNIEDTGLQSVHQRDRSDCVDGDMLGYNCVPDCMLMTEELSRGARLLSRIGPPPC